MAERIDVSQCLSCGAQFAVAPTDQRAVARRVHEAVGQALRVLEHAQLPDTRLIRPPIGTGLHIARAFQCPLCRRDLLGETGADAIVYVIAGAIVVRFASAPPKAAREALKAAGFSFVHPVWVHRIPAMRRAQVAAHLGEPDADEQLARAEEATLALAERIARTCAAHGLRTVLVRAVVANGLAYDVLEPDIVSE